VVAVGLGVFAVLFGGTGSAVLAVAVCGSGGVIVPVVVCETRYHVAILGAAGAAFPGFGFSRAGSAILIPTVGGAGFRVALFGVMLSSGVVIPSDVMPAVLVATVGDAILGLCTHRKAADRRVGGSTARRGVLCGSGGERPMNLQGVSESMLRIVSSQVGMVSEWKQAEEAKVGIRSQARQGKGKAERDA